VGASHNPYIEGEPSAGDAPPDAAGADSTDDADVEHYHSGSARTSPASTRV
jgi:hypothetical protein